MKAIINRYDRRFDRDCDKWVSQALNRFTIQVMPDTASQLIHDAVTDWGHPDDAPSVSVNSLVRLVENYVRHVLTNYDNIIGSTGRWAKTDVCESLKELVSDEIFATYGDIHDDIVSFKKVTRLPIVKADRKAAPECLAA